MLKSQSANHAKLKDCQVCVGIEVRLPFCQVVATAVIRIRSSSSSHVGGVVLYGKGISQHPTLAPQAALQVLAVARDVCVEVGRNPSLKVWRPELHCYSAEAMIASCLEEAATKSHLSIEGACRMQA